MLAQLAAPAAGGLFHKAIAHSPGGVNTPPNDFLTPVLAGLDDGAGGEASGGEAIDRLRAADVDRLLELQVKVAFNGGDVDGTVVTRHPTEAAAERGIPLIVGTNADEGTLFSAILAQLPGVFEAVTRGIAAQVVRGADPTAYLAAVHDAHPADDPVANAERVWVDLFRRTAIETAAAATTGGAGGRLYRFDVPTTVLGGGLGATHASEIAFTFNWFDRDGIGLVMHDRGDAEAAALARRWSDTIVAFARTGDPNGAGLPHWPRYGPDDRRCLVLDRQSRVDDDPDAEHRKVWEQ